MKIISKFRDYYDSAVYQATGGDSDGPLYLRETTGIELKSFPKEIEAVRAQMPRSPSARYRSTTGRWLGDYHGGLAYIVRGVVAFCGKAYPVYVQPLWEYTDVEGATNNFLQKWPCLDASEQRHNEKTFEAGPPPGYYADEEHTFSRANVERAFKDTSGTNVPDTVFIELGAPVVLFYAYRPEGKMTVKVAVTNPNLNKLEFYKHVNPFMAFQELSMYLGNVLTTPDGSAYRTGDDEVVMRQKGFDEWSFKTMAPGSKKTNRKTNRARKKGVNSKV